MRKYMDLSDIAELWGLDPGTVRRYKFEGRLPPPDGVIGMGDHRRKEGWLPETIAAIERPTRPRRQ